MDAARAMEILDPDRKPDFSPAEYEDALEMARNAIRFIHDYRGRLESEQVRLTAELANAQMQSCVSAQMAQLSQIRGAGGQNDGT